MPSAAAAFIDDFGAGPQPRKKVARKPRPAGKGGRKGGPFRTDRVARFAAIGMSVTIGVGILVNALMMQKGHHPAPLFAQAEAAPAAQEPAVAAAPAVVKPVAAKPVEAVQPPIAKTAAKAERTAPQAAADGGDDAIARLLKGGSAAPAVDKGEAKTMLGVQKALSKLGFPVKASGAMGAPTRKAIEAFEKDRHLPVKGEVNRRLVKLLAAESGMRIE